MFDIIFWVVVGLLIGWSWPQPAWAKYLQDRLVIWFKNVLKKVRK